MVPWKFIRPVGVVTLLATGGFAAGQDVLPFSHVSRSVGAQAVIVDETSPAADPQATPAVDEASPIGGATTTTEVPDPADPAIVDPTDAPEPTAPPVVEDPAEPGTPPTTTPPPAAPDVDDDAAPPTVPAEDDATVVCAAAAETTCGPVEPVPAAATTFDARVQRCEAWWNRLADRLEERSRPRWAARARQVADRCEVLVARWQERQERRDDRRQKGDHNDDGRPDNGWHNERRDGRGDRPETAPGRTKQTSRHSEGRR